MKVCELAEKAGWKLLSGEEGTDNIIDGCYVGDLLSWVMSRAQEGNVWLTVMGNVNAVAVAVLTDVAAIVLTENAPLDEEALKKAVEQGVPVYTCEKNSFETAVLIYEMTK
jgi:Predicted transcriptional regulator containing CBS domains